MMLYEIRSLDSNIKYGFMATSPYDALLRLRYYLNLHHQDNNAEISMAASGRFLYLDHNGETYYIRNKWEHKTEAE